MIYHHLMINNPENEWQQTWTTSCHGRLREQKRLLGHLKPHITDQELWQKSGEHLNSIGHLLQHIIGNMNQYILQTLGADVPARSRHQEFEDHLNVHSDELFAIAKSTIDQCLDQIAQVDGQTWLKIHEIQIFQMTTMEAVMHSIEHNAYHIGQIALLVKQKKGIDLKFYPGV